MLLGRRARLRKAPSGSREVVDALPTQVDKTILWWGKLGYDLHDRSEFQTPPKGRTQIPGVHVILTFVKK